MIYVPTESADWLYAADGQGPVHYRTEDILKRFAGQPSARPLRPVVRGQMELADLPRSPGFMKLTSPYMLLVRDDMFADCGGEFLEDCIVAEAAFDRVGRFVAIDLDLLEGKFLPRIDFSRSELMTAEMVALFGGSGPDCESDLFTVGSAEEFAAKKKAVGFFLVLYARKLVLTEPWPAKFFSFDGMLYAATELNFDACGLQRERCTCELSARKPSGKGSTPPPAP